VKLIEILVELELSSLGINWTKLIKREINSRKQKQKK